MYILRGSGLASRRRLQVTSNVRPRMKTMATGFAGCSETRSKHVRLALSKVAQSIQCRRRRSTVARAVRVSGPRLKRQECSWSPGGASRLAPRSKGLSSVPPQGLPSRSTAAEAAWSTHNAQGHAPLGCAPARAWPNTSVNLRANGMPPGPSRRYGVHFPRLGPGVTPSSPGYLER